MIKYNKPYTCENGYTDAQLLSSLSTHEYLSVLNWINDNIIPRKTMNPYHDSYEIKHLLQDDTGIYLTNNQFKDAMMICGYYPDDQNDLNWNYCISQKSRAFIRYKINK